MATSVLLPQPGEVYPLWDGDVVVDTGEVGVFDSSGGDYGFSPDELHLLSLYAANADKFVPNQAATDLMWHESSQEAALTNLRVRCNAIRRRLGPEAGHPINGVLRTMMLVGKAALSTSDETKLWENNAHRISSHLNGRLEVYEDLYAVRTDGTARHNLSLTEFRVVSVLAKAANHFVSSEELIKNALDGDPERPGMRRLLTKTVSNTRLKLGDGFDDAQEGAIVSLQDEGYILREPTGESDG